MTSPDPTSPRPRPVSTRRKSAARLAALQTLFEITANTPDMEEAAAVYRRHFMPRLLEDFAIDAVDDALYSALLSGVSTRRKAIDEAIRPLLKEGWVLERLSGVDTAALRCGYVELDEMPATPTAVVVGEYTALAESCGGDHAFVNAVLDRLAREIRVG